MHQYRVKTGSAYPGYAGQAATFCLVEAGLTRFYIGSRALIMACVSDQSNELSVLDGDDESVSPDFLYHILKD